MLARDLRAMIEETFGRLPANSLLRCRLFSQLGVGMAGPFRLELRKFPHLPHPTHPILANR